MPLPAEIHVRISSETAGAITMTPVVNQTMPVRELIEVIVSVTGKDLARVCEVLHRGGVVQGASRFRWQPFEAAEADVNALLVEFPDPDPARRFNAERCTGARLRSGLHLVEVTKQVASERRLLKRRSFWDTLMSIAGSGSPEYIGYSYRLRADEYRVRVSVGQAALLREEVGLVKYSGLVSQIRALDVEWVEFVVSYP